MPLINALGGVLGAGIQAASAQGQQNRQYEMDQALMGQQFNQNVNMWNMQNKYNSPSAQMARMREGGLNPALMYGGKGGGMAGNASSAPSPITPQRTKAANYGNAAMAGMLAFQDIKLKQAQTDNVNSQTEKNQEQSQLIAQQKLTEEQTTNRATYGAEMEKIRLDNQKEFQKYDGNSDSRWPGESFAVQQLLGAAEKDIYGGGANRIDYKVLHQLWEQDQQLKLYIANTKNAQMQADLKAEELSIYQAAKLYMPAGKLGLALFKAIFGK